MSLLEGTAAKVVAVVLAGVVVTGGALGAAVTSGVVEVSQPTIESIDNEWGAITDNRSEIRTSVTVNNPNAVSVPGIAGVAYDVRMNGIEVAHGERNGVGLPKGESTLTVETGVDNGKIPEWWATHIDNGERTTVSVEPSVRAPLYSSALPAQNRTFETDMLAPFDSDQRQELAVGGRTLLAIEETRASWGDATAERTPLSFSATVSNPSDRAFEFSRLGYEVAMNNITLAEGTTDESVAIAPGATETIDIRSVLDNDRLDDWWVSHLRNDERTRLDVRVFAVADRNGEAKRIPLSFLSRSVRFQTDILNGGAPTVTELGTGAFEPPAITATDSEWVTDGDATGVRTEVTVDNPNEAFADLPLAASYRVSMNDVTLAEQRTNATLQTGENVLRFEDTVTDREIRAWWVSHVNNGERTVQRREANVTADLGFADVAVDVPSQRSTFETDMLANANSDDPQTVTAFGRDIATVDDVRASWGEATMDRTPIESSAAVTNERNRKLSITAVGYEVRMNNVTLASDEQAKSVDIAPGERERIEVVGHLDNENLGDWWPTHVQNGERTELDVRYYVVAEFLGQTRTVSLDGLSYTQTFETDILGTDE